MLLESDPDYVVSRRFDNSLTKVMERYQDGAPDRLVAAILLMTEDDVRTRLAEIFAIIRADLKVEETK